MLQRPGESYPWQSGLHRTEQPHDNDNDKEIEIPQVNYFGPAKFYCIETICAPCGVIIAWTKFDKSESPTNILNFFYKKYILQKSLNQHIFVLIRLVEYFRHLSYHTKVGICGRKLVVLLWIHIIISIMTQQTIVANGATLVL
jgi:hypothetical protein